MFDLHTHHDRCGHALGGLRDYLNAAIDNGLRIVGLSDHSPFFCEPEEHHKPGVAMAKGEFARYIAEALRLREEYRGRIEVLVGVESDFFPEHASAYRDVFGQYPLDYIIGSVHVMDGVDLFRRERWIGADRAALKAARERYCGLVAQSARTRMFDVLGHIDVVKAVCPEIAQVATGAVDRMMRDIADADVVIEVNTSGKTKDCGGWYPSIELLECARRYGVKVTFGSDAHDPSRVGDEHEAVRETLRELGFRHWYVFAQRRRVSLPL